MHNGGIYHGRIVIPRQALMPLPKKAGAKVPFKTMKKKKFIWAVAGLVILFPLINFYLTPQLPEKTKMEIQNFEAEDDIEFIRIAYDDIGKRFNSREKCWRDDYEKNYIVDGEEIFALEGECLPCHIQNNLLQAYLLESGRFIQEQLITKVTVCWDVPMLHVYTEVHLDNGSIVNVDTWGQHWNISFGQTIKDVEVCTK